MYKDERDLLEVLKSELTFLENDGYEHSQREPWRPQFIFEDSPTCMNYESPNHPGPCDSCVLIQLVPMEYRHAKTPCRYIPFNDSRETLDCLYRYADQFEIQQILGKWLRTTTAKLEGEREVRKTNLTRATDPPTFKDAVPLCLCHNPQPKCANPSCGVAFHWLGGGKFFRFRPHGATENSGHCGGNARGNVHGVKHFWLCEHCSHIFTLVYQGTVGVVLKLRWEMLPLVDPPKEIPQSSETGAKELEPTTTSGL